MTELLDIASRRLLVVADDDPVVRDTQGVADLLAQCMAEDARMIVLPAGRIDSSFFDLRSGFAGEVLQKLANYRFKLAILGDISAHIQASAAFRDFVREADRGDAVFFCTDLAALSVRLAAPNGSAAGEPAAG